eukprot:gene8919-868_t
MTRTKKKHFLNKNRRKKLVKNSVSKENIQEVEDVITISDEETEVTIDAPSFDIPKKPENNKQTPVKKNEQKNFQVTPNRYFDESSKKMESEEIGKSKPLALHTNKKQFNVVCTICGQTKHFGYQCPNAICYACLNPGHVVADCPFKKSKSCDWCSRKGHDENSCPVKEMNITRSDIVPEVHCFFCGEKSRDIIVFDAEVKIIQV